MGEGITELSKDWKQKSRKQVDEVVSRANFKSPKFVGWKTKDNIAVLEKAKVMIQEREKDHAGEVNG